ncbi:MAG: VOC family protein [Acidimicrobiales bacterium]
MSAAGQDGGMHRSRLTAALVDVPQEQYREVVQFWSGALGVEAEIDDDDPNYASIGEPVPGFQFMVQQVDAPARIHLDIETDDVDAEVDRLEGLGAERVEKIESWWVMRDPAGNFFCVVRVQDPAAFERDARAWD